MAAPASSKVAGKRSAISLTTARFVRNDVPRSPVAAPLTNATYLHEERPIEAETGPHFSHVLRRRAVAKHCLDGITRNEMNEGEDERRHAEEHRNREQETPEKKTNHPGQ